MVALTRQNFYNTFVDGPYFKASITLYFVSIIMASFYLFINYTRLVVNNNESSFGKIALFCQNCWLGINAADIITIVSTLTMSFVLLGRVSLGQCSSDVSLWDTQRCNPVSYSKSLPADQVILVYFYPIIASVTMKGVSLECILVSPFFIPLPSSSSLPPLPFLLL